VRRGLPALDGFRGDVLVLYGDLPLVEPATLRRLVRARRGRPLAMATVALEKPGAYGRVLRDARGGVRGVVEAKDATAAELAGREINTGLYAIDGAFLRRALPRLRADNRQREYYLTDLVAMA